MIALQQLRREALSRMHLPAGRFFVPREAFFSVLREYKVGYIDAGCGSGETTTEAQRRGIAMLGVDLAPREGQEVHVLQCDASLMHYSPSLWPVVCRPSHDGWCEDVLEVALSRGAHAMYVGFSKNHARDLGRLRACIHKRWRWVGKSREGMVLLSPALYRERQWRRKQELPC